jgi:hypothetical protein
MAGHGGSIVTTVAFHADLGYAEVSIGHEATLQIRGPELSAGGPALARHENGVWFIGTQRLARITCQGRFQLEIETQGGIRRLGPLTELCLVDDLVVTFDGPIARYSPSHDTWLAQGASVTPDLKPLIGNFPLPSVVASGEHEVVSR